MPRSAALAGLLLSLLLPAGLGTAAEPGPETYVPGQVLVKFKTSATAQVRRGSLAARGHALIAELREPGWAQVRVNAGQSVADAVASYRDDPRVEYAQPNYVYRGAAVPDDPSYLQEQLWGLKNTGKAMTNAFTQPPNSRLSYDDDHPGSNPGTAGSDINVEPAWNTITDCSGVVVAVLDTGVNYNHEDLASNMWVDPSYSGLGRTLHGYNFVDGNDDPMDAHGHGTHVAGTIGAVGNNGKGVTGVCWKASIMAVRVLDAKNSGTTAWFVNGISYAIDHGAKVINMSIIGDGPFDQAYSDAITKAQAKDVVVVVCAGNDALDNDKTPAWPCNFPQPNLLCVAALDQKYQLAGFSNYGATKVAIGAPGTNVLSTWPGTGGAIADSLTGGWTGTGGWGSRDVVFNVNDTDREFACLVDPPTYPAGLYAANADERVYKTFTVGAVSTAVLGIRAAIDVADGDYFGVAFRKGAGDPFGVDGTPFDPVTGSSSKSKLKSESYDVTACKDSPCTIGFRVLSGTTARAKGVAITGFSIATLTWNERSYGTIDGTSMATPHVAGVATMLRAYNPLFTFEDVVRAVQESGRSVPSLAGKTKTGKAVDAMRALSFIQAPTGVSATVQ